MAKVELLAFVLLLALVLLCNRVCSQYREVYPDRAMEEDQWHKADENGTIPLYFALMMSFSGDYKSHGVVPGVQVALDRINQDSSILPGYRLHYTLTDSECNRTHALKQLFRQVLHEPVKLALIGSGCSVATEPTAEVSHYYNISQISCVSSSSELVDRTRFRYYYQLLPTEADIAPAYYGVIRQYGWRHVSLIIQNENRFTVTMERLKSILTMEGVTYHERLFESEDSITGLGENPFDGGARIFIIAMHSIHARQLMCEAYRLGLHYPRHLFLTYGWYEPKWWNPPLDEDVGQMCTAIERASVLQYSFAVLNFKFLTDADNDFDTDTGITGAEYEHDYEKKLEIPPLYYPTNEYAQQCYDATWTLAYALNKTLNGVSGGNQSGLEDFTYDNSLLYEYLQETNFTGISGRVNFNENGTRTIETLHVLQYRITSGSDDDDGVEEELELVEVATVSMNYAFKYVVGEDDSTVWDGGPVPYDGIANEKLVTVHGAVSLVFSVLASMGIVFTTVCLLFNFIFRKRKLIRLTSPALNYLIGAGAIIFYVDVYVYVSPSTDQVAVSALCQVKLWLSAIGYSLCFGTIVAKMWRVFHIFHNPHTPKGKWAIQDWHLGVFVGVLVLIDVIILILYTVIVGIFYDFSAEKVTNHENPQETEGELEITTNYYIYSCTSIHRFVVSAVLFGYKTLLHIVALFFAITTRKVKVKGLDDAKYIAAIIYISSLILVVTILITFTVRDLVNVFAAIFSISLLVTPTVILGLVFIPKMVSLYRDPEGELVFASERTSQGTTNAITGTLDREGPGTEMLRARIKELERVIDDYKKITGIDLVVTSNPRPTRATFYTSTGMRMEPIQEVAESNQSEEEAESSGD